MNRSSVARSMMLALSLGLLVQAGPVRADDTAAARELFTAKSAPPCGVCHTLKDAGTDGMVGPVLDELKPNAQRVATALRNGIGAMPSYRDQLTSAQIELLARYVARVAGAN